MTGIKQRNTKKVEMTVNEMVTNKLQKQTKYLEKNNNLATENNIRQLPTKKKKKKIIVGDSMIKNITGTGT